jgi:hypothetical protein
VAQLGTAPLVGPVASTPQLQDDVRQQRAVFEAAGIGLGLSPAQFAQFEGRIARGQLAYVTIPRHLDAMSWRSAGRVHVLRDVIIPAGTHGWEVDLVDHGEILALFIPNKCGNLSLLRRPAPALARVVPPAPVQTEANIAPPQATPASAPSPAPIASPSPAPYAALASSTGPTHHARLWPLLLLPLIGFILSHGHSGPVAIGPGAPAPPVPAPTSPPAGCPQPTPH